MLLTALLMIGIAVQAGSGIILHHRGPGWSPTTVAEYYRGREVDPASLTPAQLDAVMAGDPAFANTPPKTIDALLDVAHMHLAWMPLIVFLVAHLFAMCPWGRNRFGSWLSYTTFVAALLDIAAPFLIRYGDPLWAWLKLTAFISLEGGLLTMIGLTLGSGIAALRRSAAPS